MKTRLHRWLLAVYRRMPRGLRRGIVRRFSPQYTVGAICIVERDDGRVLLVRQSYRNRWGVPGGLLRRGEDAADGARREALEEVGIDIELVGEPTVVVAPDPRRVDVIYRAKPASAATADDAHPSSPEIVEARWFSPTELPELQEETADAVRALARASLRPAARPLAR
ncbi:MAG: NUDIX domain-containing protein [Acidimicrobiales bacterium]